MKETVEELLNTIDFVANDFSTLDDFESKCVNSDIANKAIDAREDIKNMVKAIEMLLNSSAIQFAINNPEDYGDDCVECIEFAEEVLGYHQGKKV